MNNPNYMVRDLVGKNSTDRDDRPSYTSIIYGLALGNSEKGYVEVKLLGDGKNETKDFLYWERKDGPGVGFVESEERGIFLPTTVNVQQGDLAVITTTGQTERKMIVTGVAGGGDITAGEMKDIRNEQLDIHNKQVGYEAILKRFMEFYGDPVCDGTNLFKNTTFNSLDNWTIDYGKYAYPDISFSNEYTDGAYQSIKLVFGRDNYHMTLTQTYDFSNPMFNPVGDNWFVGTLYWYIFGDHPYATLSNNDVFIRTSLQFSSNDNKISFRSNDFNGLVTNYNFSRNNKWGRYRSIILLEYEKGNEMAFPFYGYVNPKMEFVVSIDAERKYGDSTDTATAYINRPKLEWGGLPTPWTP